MTWRFPRFVSLEEVRDNAQVFRSRCLLTASIPLAAQPAAAQTGGDIAIGYSFLSNSELAANATSLPAGFFFDTSLQVNEFMSIAMDINGHFKRGIEASSMYSGGPSDPVVRPLENQDFQAFSFNRPEVEYCSPVLTACEVHIQAVGAVAGPASTSTPAVRARSCTGWSGSRGRCARSGSSRTRQRTWRSSRAVGLTFSMTPNTAFRIQADYRMTFFPVPDQADPGSQSSLVNVDGTDFRDFTFSLGVVVNLGARRN